MKWYAYRHVNAQVWIWVVHFFFLLVSTHVTSLSSLPIYFGLDSSFFLHGQPLLSPDLALLTPHWYTLNWILETS